MHAWPWPLPRNLARTKFNKFGYQEENAEFLPHENVYIYGSTLYSHVTKEYRYTLYCCVRVFTLCLMMLSLAAVSSSNRCCDRCEERAVMSSD